MLFDAGSFVVSIVKAWREAKQWQAWGRLVFGMAFSGIIAHYGIKGASLLVGALPPIAEGRADVAVAVSLLCLFLSSPLTRGITISIPQSVVREQIEHADQETITRG